MRSLLNFQQEGGAALAYLGRINIKRWWLQELVVCPCTCWAVLSLMVRVWVIAIPLTPCTTVLQCPCWLEMRYTWLPTRTQRIELPSGKDSAACDEPDTDICSGGLLLRQFFRLHRGCIRVYVYMCERLKTKRGGYHYRGKTAYPPRFVFKRQHLNKLES